MVEQEFGQTQRRRKYEKSSKTEIVSGEDGTTEDEIDNSIGAGKMDDTLLGYDDENDVVFWKKQCFRLKQEIFEKKNQSQALIKRHKEELVAVSSMLKDALAEASHDRDLKDALVETLEAQTKHSEGLSKQLVESRKNSMALQNMWKEFVKTMEGEK